MIAFLVALAATLATPDAVPPRPSAGCSLATVEHGRRIEGSVDVAGTRRAYVLDVPETVQAKKPAPLLLDFHGFGHSGAGVWEVSGFRKLAPAAGLITAYPEGQRVKLHLRGVEREAPGWQMFRAEDNGDLAFVTALLDDLERRYCIDKARVFATGFSNGAFFSAMLACRMADRIAAAAPVAGGPLQNGCTPSRPVPMLIQHGRQDDLLPIDYGRALRDNWLALNQCAADQKRAEGPNCERWTACRDGATVEFCEGDYAHTWPPDATQRVWEFLRQHPMP